MYPMLFEKVVQSANISRDAQPMPKHFHTLSTESALKEKVSNSFSSITTYGALVILHNPQAKKVLLGFQPIVVG